MAHSLAEFLNAATADTIRCTNQYELEATSGYSDVDAILEGVMLYGQSATIPSRTVNYAEVSFKGYAVPNLVPTNIDMTKEFSFEVLEDVNGQNRRAFERWMDHVMNFNIEGGSLFEGDRGVNPKSLIRLRLFDKDNETVCQTYKFWNVHIKNVSDTSLTYSGGDAARFTVQAVCSYWSIEESKNGALLDLK